MPRINALPQTGHRKYKYVVSKVEADDRAAIADKMNEMAGHGYKVLNQRVVEAEDGTSDLFITFQRRTRAPSAE